MRRRTSDTSGVGAQLLLRDEVLPEQSSPSNSWAPTGCDAPAPAPEGSAPPRRGRTSDTLGVGAQRLLRDEVLPEQLSPSNSWAPTGCDAPVPAPEGSAPPRRGRTSDTLPTESADCGRRCDAPVPAPEGSAPPRRGRTSLKRQLLVLALAIVVAVWLAAAAFTYFDAREEFDEVLDAHLAQSAALLSAQASHELDEIDTEHAPQLHKYARKVAFQIWEDGEQLRLHSANAPQHHLTETWRGFSDTTLDGKRWRVFSTWTNPAHT